MNTIKKYTGRSFWLAGLLLTSLIAGCGGGSSGTTEDSPVLSTSPAGTTTEVALNSKVLVSFSEEMDADTFTPQSFTVTGENEAAFLTSRSSIYIASVNSNGWPYIQHRGGPAGFIKLLDPHTIGDWIHPAAFSTAFRCLPAG